MKRVFRKITNPGQRPVLRRRPQRGSIMVLTSIAIAGMIGITALAIDLGFIFSIRNQFQNGIDAAALACATALRVSIEPDLVAPHQTSLVRQQAVQFAGFNQVRRYSDPPKDSGQLNKNNIVLDPTSIAVDMGTDPGKVTINTTLNSPLLFAGIFGFGTMDIGAESTASLFPVDGGTGTIGGCWRPLMLPDTFYDISDNVHIVGDPARGGFNLPDQNGDYYRSRYAVGGRDLYPYVDSLSGIRTSVTGLRDAQLMTEVGIKSIMGQQIEFSRDYYRIANFSGLPQSTFDPLSAQDFANFGYCGEIRVGTDLPVYSPTDFTTYDQVRMGLSFLKGRTNDSVDLSILAQYRYIKSSSYPGPNTHAAIIPVLLFNPLELIRNPGAATLKVTNIGLFFLSGVEADGRIQGFFVREIMTGGLPIDAANFGVDNNPSFRPTWLPMSVRLLK